MLKPGDRTVAAWLAETPGPAGSGGEGFAPLARHPSRLSEAVSAGAGSKCEPLGETELEELRGAHRRWGADEASMVALEKLGSAKTRVIVAGQQPGILTGPLYTLYKALGAAARARSLAAAHPDLDFIPVFWVASEDHDFAEIRTARWPDLSGGFEEVSLDDSLHQPGAMVGPIRPQGFGDILASRIEASTRETDFRAGVIDLLRCAHADGRTLEDAFCTLLLELTRGRGIVIVSPLMSWVRRRALPVLLREIELAGGSTAAILKRNDELAREGYAAPMHRHAGAVNLFHVDPENRRCPVRADGDSFVIMRPAGSDSRSDGTRLSALELRARIGSDPGSAAFNVVTRPVVQDSVLPVVAQIVGPGEAAYLAQVEAVYPLFGVEPATRLPRPGAVLLTPPLDRALAKAGLTPEQALAAPGEELLRNLLSRGPEGDALRALWEIRLRHESELRAALGVFDKSQPVQSALEKMFQAAGKGYANLESRILAESERRQSELAAAVARIESWLRPLGRPQERVLNPFVPFMVQYGPDWPRRANIGGEGFSDSEMNVIRLG